MVQRPVAAMMVLFLCACSQRPDPQLYVLSPAPEAVSSGASRPQAKIAVLRVRLPNYLERQQIVSRNGPNALAVNQDARWGEPLDEGLPRILAENLSHHLPDIRVVVPQQAQGEKVRYEYDVALDAYEPDGSGNAVMRGRWRLFDNRNGKLVSEGLIDERHPLASNGAADVVAALNDNLTEASRQIAEATAQDVGR